MQYYCVEHLESSLDDRTPDIGFAKYVVKAQLIEDGSTEDITVLDIDDVHLFSSDGSELSVTEERLAEISKWLEDEALDYLCKRRDVCWILKTEDAI